MLTDMQVDEVPLQADESVPIKRGGTNPPPMDFAEIEKFGVMGTSVADMALIMQVPLERLKRQLDNPNSRTARSYERGRALRRFSLDKKAYQVAIGVEDGNVPLLVRFLEWEKAKEPKQDNRAALLENVLATLTEEQKQEIVKMAMGNSTDTDIEVDDE